MKKIIITLPYEIKRAIGTCNMNNQIKCEYCKHQDTCRERQLQVALQKLEDSYNDKIK